MDQQSDGGDLAGEGPPEACSHCEPYKERMEVLQRQLDVLADELNQVEDEMADQNMDLLPWVTMQCDSSEMVFRHSFSFA